MQVIPKCWRLGCLPRYKRHLPISRSSVGRPHVEKITACFSELERRLHRFSRRTSNHVVTLQAATRRSLYTSVLARDSYLCSTIGKFTGICSCPRSEPSLLTSSLHKSLDLSSLARLATMAREESDHVGPVIIIGGGPVGLTCSILLSLRGITNLVFERHLSTSIHPKACGINQRTTEIFRVMGIEREVYASATPAEIAGRTAWYTSLGEDGKEVFSRCLGRRPVRSGIRPA